MPGDKALSVSLEEFGLSRYEARAYVALVSRGPSSAGELAYYAGIPRTKVYPVLQKLEGKGLAVVTRGRRVTCAPVAPDSAFDGVIQEHIDRVSAMNSLVDGLKAASDRGRRARGSEEMRYVQLPAGGAQARLAEMVGGASESVRASAGRLGMGLLAGCRAQLAAAVGRGAGVMVITEPAQAGTAEFRAVPAGASVRVAGAAHDTFVVDGTEVLAVDAASGRCASFQAAGVLGASQAAAFDREWEGAASADCLADMDADGAQEVCRAVRAVGDGALGCVLAAGAGGRGADLLGMLERSGVSLGGRGIADVVEVVDLALQMSCSGRAALDAGGRSISVESGLNSGHSLPWAAILDEHLRGSGHRTRMTYQSLRRGGERVHLRFGAQD